MLFGYLPATLYDQPPTATRRAGATKSLLGKKGQIIIRGNHGKDFVEFTKYRKGASARLQIAVNDEDLNFRTIKDAYSQLQTYWPLSSSLYYQLVFLRGVSNNISLNGTGTQRHAFFEEIFQLSIYDQIATILRQKHRKAQEAKSQLDALDPLSKHLSLIHI